MDKITFKYVRYFKARQRYQLKRAKWYKGTRKRKVTPQKRTRLPDFADAKAPQNFTLAPDNIRVSLEYIGKVKRIGKSKRDVNFILDDVHEIGIGAISMLISVMEELKEKSIYFKGTKPTRETPKNILEQSGFMKYVKGTIDKANLRTKNTIFTTGKSNTHQRFIIEAIHAANNTVWGEPGRSPLLYGTIVEMIKNSCKHAFKSQDRVRWHIAVNHDEENNKVKFSFVDNGIGIINSFEKADLTRIFKQFFKNNAEFIETAYKDGIESKTGKSWRGTGLPTIHETFEDQVIKKLVVITNNVYVDFETKQRIVLDKTFSGTYYYWEMDRSCVKHCFL